MGSASTIELIMNLPVNLSSEDNLRINVLLNQDLHALRIDDSKMIIYGLSAKGEAVVKLNPNCRDEQYIKKVKELISSHVLGSPGGYPVYLRRWTRMGQAKEDSLERLLQLGEPEAVVAVVHANGISNEIARRAWWSMPNSINARCMLKSPDVVNGDMGRVLAEFLLEFLPFEEEPKDIINSVRLVLQGDLITADEKNAIWKKGQRKNAFLVGFLHTLPDDVLDTTPAHPMYAECVDIFSADDSIAANLALRILSEKGQAFLKTVLTVMKKPINQDVVIELMEAINGYFYPLLNNSHLSALESSDNLEEVKKRTEQLMKNIQICIKQKQELTPVFYAMLYLAQLGEQTTNPVFSRTDAIGTVMRKKLEPVFEPIFEQLNILYAGKN